MLGVLGTPGLGTPCPGALRQRRGKRRPVRADMGHGLVFNGQLMSAVRAPREVETPVRRSERSCGARAATGERHHRHRGAGTGAEEKPEAAAEEARGAQARRQRRLHAQERRLKPPPKGVALLFLCRRGGDGTRRDGTGLDRTSALAAAAASAARPPPRSAPRRPCPPHTCGAAQIPGARPFSGPRRAARERRQHRSGPSRERGECLSPRRVWVSLPVASPVVPCPLPGRRPPAFPRRHEHQRRLPPADQHPGPLGSGRLGHRPALRDELPCGGGRRRRHPHPQDLLLPEDLRGGLRLRRIRVGAGRAWAGEGAAPAGPAPLDPPRESCRQPARRLISSVCQLASRLFSFLTFAEDSVKRVRG